MLTFEEPGEFWQYSGQSTGLGTGVAFSAGPGIIFSLLTTSLLTNGFSVLLSRGYSSRGIKVTIYLCLLARLRISGATNRFPMRLHADPNRRAV